MVVAAGRDVARRSGAAGPAIARLRAADHLAREAGHDAIRAWVLETRAWQLLALALLGRGELGEAADSTLRAITSGHVVPSNRWRAREAITAIRQADTREAKTLRDAYATMVEGS